jgi:hypothetical protein
MWEGRLRTAEGLKRQATEIRAQLSSRLERSGSLNETDKDETGDPDGFSYASRETG